MFSPFERMTAWRYLRSRKQEGFLSVIAGFSFVGIMLGVATLIVVMAVMNGFRQELLGRILGLNGHLHVMAIEGNLGDYPPLIPVLSKIDGVTSIVPMIEGQALVTRNGAASGVVVRGMDGVDIRQRKTISNKIIAGNLADFDADAENPHLLIGKAMAENYGLRVGDSLTLVSPKFGNSPFGSMPRARAYPIAAIFDLGMYEYDSSYIFMPLEAAQGFFLLGDTITALEMEITRPYDDILPARQKVVTAIGPGWQVRDWQQSNGSFFSALQIERNVMFLILSLIVLIAAFNIISSLIMLVKEKGRNIAILRTMGATQGSIMRIFFLTGAAIGVVGTALGLGLGLALTLNLPHIQHWLEGLTGKTLWDPTIRFLTEIPADLDWKDVWRTMAMALILSFLATLYPSWRAARLDPVEALRHE